MTSQKPRNIKIALCMLSILAAVLCLVVQVNAATPEQLEEIKDQWREKRDYPVQFLDDELQDDGYGHLYPVTSKEWNDLELGLFDQEYILNPPEDILKSFSSEELAALMQRWPLLTMMTTYNDSEERYDIFWGFAERHSDIFFELLSREDGYTCILEEYRKNPFDAAKNNDDPDLIFSFDPIDNAELFGCQFIRYYNSFFTQEEYELASEIIDEKLALYENLNEQTRYWLNLTQIEPPTGEPIVGVRSRSFESVEERQEVLKEYEEALKEYEETNDMLSEPVLTSEEITNEDSEEVSEEAATEEATAEVDIPEDEQASVIEESTDTHLSPVWLIVILGIIGAAIVVVLVLRKKAKNNM